MLVYMFNPFPTVQFEWSLLVLIDSGQMWVWILPSNIAGRHSPEGSSTENYDAEPKSALVITVHPLATPLSAYNKCFHFYA